MLPHGYMTKRGEIKSLYRHSLPAATQATARSMPFSVAGQHAWLCEQLHCMSLPVTWPVLHQATPKAPTSSPVRCLQNKAKSSLVLDTRQACGGLLQGAELHLLLQLCSSLCWPPPSVPPLWGTPEVLPNWAAAPLTPTQLLAASHPLLPSLPCHLPLIPGATWDLSLWQRIKLNFQLSSSPSQAWQRKLSKVCL